MIRLPGAVHAGGALRPGRRRSNAAARAWDSKSDQATGGHLGHDECMNASTDTFAAFVHVLAQALDDHEATGEELARRVHLSRFHFDRVFAATAGETPGAFRRRVLLERAAYRL